MKAEKGVIERLNKILKNELTAINQYFLHSRMLHDWGFARLAEKEYEESLDEMRHAQSLTDRILFLEGLPNLQALNRLRIGENVKELLAADLKLEEEALPDLKEAIVHMESVGDFVSRNLVREILDSEEEHIDWLETQIELVEKVGIENYQQTMIGAE